MYLGTKFLKDRLLHLAEDRLRLRPFELAALQHELQSPFRQNLMDGWSMRLLAIEVEMQNRVAAMIAGPTAYDTRLIALIDQWAAEQPASSVTPLPPKAPAPSVSSPLRLPAATPEKPAAAPPKQRGTAQDEAVLAKIRELDHTPLSLPKNSPGKPGVEII